jgi:hypothetical protein
VLRYFSSILVKAANTDGSSAGSDPEEVGGCARPSMPQRSTTSSPALLPNHYWRTLTGRYPSQAFPALRWLAGCGLERAGDVGAQDCTELCERELHHC